MKYGCIGEKLGHSFSKEIHGEIADYEYEIKEIPRDGLDSFMRARDFNAINVTIPYKEMVMPYLDHVDDACLAIGATNTVVNRCGKLYGYNTDFYGLSALAKRYGISFEGKKVLILGTGGTSKTAYAVAKSYGAREIVKASRKADNSSVLYTDVYKYHTDSEIIINTTPVGMYPNIHAKPIELSRFSKLIGVIDAIYNPLSTELISEARSLGVKAAGGLYMLVAQGVKASEYFLDTKYPEALCDEIFDRIESAKENIVLIGMPGSGKSTVGRILAKRLGRRLVDTDDEVVKTAATPISDIFLRFGEEHFRLLESEAVDLVSPESGIIIATGGGVPLKKENMRMLRQNGRIYFIDRPLSALIPTKDRPLAQDFAAIEKRYRERYEIYKSSADVIINADCSKEEVAELILGKHLERK